MARAPGIGACSVPFNVTFCDFAIVDTPVVALLLMAGDEGQTAVWYGPSLKMGG